MTACPGEVGTYRQVVDEVIFALAAGTGFAHQPCGMARKMLPMRSQYTIGNTHAHSSKAR